LKSRVDHFIINRVTMLHDSKFLSVPQLFLMIRVDHRIVGLVVLLHDSMLFRVLQFFSMICVGHRIVALVALLHVRQVLGGSRLFSKLHAFATIIPISEWAHERSQWVQVNFIEQLGELVSIERGANETTEELEVYKTKKKF
jgi:hypothetical protein